MVSTVYTLGHSNRTLTEFTATLAQQPVGALVDVRAQPYSRRCPHFSVDALREVMKDAGIVYHWAGRQLGGLRAPLPDSHHTALDKSLRGFADYMQTGAFATAAAQLINMAAKAPLVLLCAERLPERCHRRLIADYLLLRGLRVVHLLDKDEAREHLLSPEARRESAQLVYDRRPSD